MEAVEEKDTEVVEESVDPIHEVAKQLGWNPDYDGDNAVDAKTYILRSREINNNLSKTVHNLRKELNAVKEGVEVVRWTAEQSSKREINRLKSEIAELKDKRRTAIEDGDAKAVDVLDDKIKNLEDATKENKVPQVKNEPPPEYFDWLESNKWYLEDKEMQTYVDTLLKTPEFQAVSMVSYPRLLKKVTASVKSEFPEKFPAKKTEPTQPPSVSSTTQRGGKTVKTKATASDLSYEQRMVGKDFVSQGLYKSLDEYAQHLQESLKK